MKGQTIFLTDKGPNMIGKKFFIVVDMRPEALESLKIQRGGDRGKQ